VEDTEMKKNIAIIVVSIWFAISIGYIVVITNALSMCSEAYSQLSDSYDQKMIGCGAYTFDIYENGKLAKRLNNWNDINTYVQDVFPPDTERYKEVWEILKNCETNCLIDVGDNRTFWKSNYIDLAYPLIFILE
jgi:hypothetical protein